MVLAQLERKRALLEEQILEEHHLGHPTDELLDYHQELTHAIHKAKRDLEYHGPSKPAPATKASKP